MASLSYGPGSAASRTRGYVDHALIRRNREAGAHCLGHRLQHVQPWLVLAALPARDRRLRLAQSLGKLLLREPRAESRGD